MYPSRGAVLPLADTGFDDDFIWRLAIHFDGSFIEEYARKLGAYERRQDVLDAESQARLIDAIDLDDAPMIRGLSAFLKTNILASSDRLFMEEATLQMFLAMEASLSIARRELENTGVNNPSLERAMEYVSAGIAPKEDALRYFKECYDKRVSLVHPVNRVAGDAVPLLWADDLYDNYEVVAEIYRRLLLSDSLD